jgi:uncharacterized protein (UPF0335 family)
MADTQIVSYGERLVRLETQMEALQNDMANVNADIKAIVSGMKTTVDLLSEMKNEQSKWKGTVGGVVLTISAIVTVLGFAKDWLIDWVRK